MTNNNNNMTTETTTTTTTDNAADLITPRSTKQIFGDDVIIDADAPDTGKSEKSIGEFVDDDIKQMSLHTMELLDSLTDEVMKETSSRGINNTSSSRLRQRSISPSSSYSSSSDNDYNNDDVDNDNDNNNNHYASAHDMALSSPEPPSRSKPRTTMMMKTPKSGNASTRKNSGNSNTTTSTTNNAQIRHIDDIDVGDSDLDDDDDDDDDMSFDGSIGDDSILNEMEKLNRVAQELQQELSTQDQLSLETKLIELQNSPKPTLRQRIVDNNDRAIINKILQEEEDNNNNNYNMMMMTGGGRRQSQKSLQTDWEKVVEKIDGIWTEQKTFILCFAVTIIWSLIFGLVYKSLYYDELI